MKSTYFAPLALAAAIGYASSASAFVITSTLSGDPRASNPDNLVVNVTITSGEGLFNGNPIAANQAAWLIDINSPAHPGVKLDAFFFNLTGLGSDYLFSGFDPSGWEITTPAANAQASGGANFLFAADKSAGNAPDITNAQSLSFLMTYALAGNLAASNFLSAPLATSNDQVLGDGQLGAHLQSLTTTGNCGSSTNCSTSGFAFGDYVGGDGGGDPKQVPEPSTILLLGAALASLGALRRRRSA